ncbi:EboA domain-containing protein [Jeongeupia naejangsanensis]|uniref:EboA domain-containing protein n=1 Tax=Jeongeupia naejangsanensis TaxID=613195 RepID=A0ABS2BGY5_9NEIS|nr:EboA domain-containing protein [Jeongeupia naejangsanensis]MBM3114872.1 EboA domain-containing protein [Jeongeupia naejangsanensis]
MNDRHRDSPPFPPDLPDHATASAWVHWQASRSAWQDLLQRWLNARTDGSWYARQCQYLALPTEIGRPMDLLFRTIGQAPRKLGKQDLALNDAERENANALQAGFNASRWSVDQAARVGMILAASSRLPNSTVFAALLDELANHGDIQEQIALYQGFALYPRDPALLRRAGEAIRSGIRPVFAAFALRSPWPQAMLTQSMWNQMIVKTFFLDLPLWPVQGLAERANENLGEILCDLIAERTAAGRSLNPEIWRLLALCPGERGHTRLRQRHAGSPAGSHEMHALQLAARESPHADIRSLAPAGPSGIAFSDEWAQLTQWQE